MIVIDASVAVKWVLQEERSEAAHALQTEQMHASELWLAECANVLWKRHRRGELDDAAVAARLDFLSRAPVRTAAIHEDIEQASRLTLALNHPIYDCLYLALALRIDAPLVTDDRGLARAAARGGLEGRVRLLAAPSP